jgi:hypothetical protein
VAFGCPSARATSTHASGLRDAAHAVLRPPREGDADGVPACRLPAAVGYSDVLILAGHASSVSNTRAQSV